MIEHDKLRELFIKACDLKGDQLTHFLDKHCSDNHQLRRQLSLLLEQDANPEGILAESKLTGGIHFHQADTVVETEVPSRIGRYEIKKLLGSGGMGAVYLAEQENPKRDVAIKVIHPGMNAELLRRFELETQVLGLLQHQGIASILEAGTAAVPDPTGQLHEIPFFAMEYVDGTQITQYAANEKLTIGQKLKITVDVCQAVQSAHQLGVIHRRFKTQQHPRYQIR